MNTRQAHALLARQWKDAVATVTDAGIVNRLDELAATPRDQRDLRHQFESRAMLTEARKRGI